MNPPSNAYTNVNMSNCSGQNGPQCIAQTVATGVPAVWEAPFVQAVNAWWSALITWASGNSEPLTPAPVSQIDYIRFGFSLGGEATINCTQYLEKALGGGISSGDAAINASKFGRWTFGYRFAQRTLIIVPC